MSKSTPGPWKFGDEFVHNHKVKIADPYVRPTAETEPGEMEANARLIAAAPDLLAALKDVELRTTQARIANSIGKKKDSAQFLLGELERIAIIARAAIAKAEGE